LKEEFTGFGAGDFRRRYNGSWGWYTIPSNKKRLLVLMELVNDDQARFSDQKGNQYVAFADQGVEFEFIPVSKKLFLYNGSMMLQSRIPAHMWSRGVNVQNTRYTNVYTGSSTRPSFDLIVAGLEPESYKEHAGMHLLNNVFGVVGRHVFVYDKLIGQLDTNCISLNDNLFVQELSDLVKKLGLNWSVKSVA
jgi:hypothetical protein